MKKLVLACAVAALIALSPKSDAKTGPRSLNRVVPLAYLQQQGLASWYGQDFQGKETSSGEPFDMNGLTAAHRTLPLGSRINVTNLRNNRSVVLRVNDRGPNHPGRILDVSKAAARRLGFVGEGFTRVRNRAVRYPKGYVVQGTEIAALHPCAAPRSHLQ